MIKIVTACGAGMGSSLVLRMWTEDVIKEMGIDAKVEAQDASGAKSAKCDLVMTSHALVDVVTNPTAHETRWVTNYLDKVSIRKQLEEFCDAHGITYKKKA
jgi:PTS system ascorbate-specific IIB component